MSASDFAPLQRFVSMFGQHDAPSIGMLREESVLLAVLLREHAEMTAHLMACTATCTQPTEPEK